MDMAGERAKSRVPVQRLVAKKTKCMPSSGLCDDYSQVYE